MCNIFFMEKYYEIFYKKRCSLAGKWRGDPVYLNVSGSEVGKLIDKNLDVTKIVEELSKKYDEDEDIIKKDVEYIVKELLKGKYIKEVK